MVFQVIETSFNLDTRATTRRVVATCATMQLAKRRLEALRKVEAEAYASVARAWEVTPISN